MTADPRVGSRFGPYLLKRLLGRGGFGEVYEAEDTAMGRTVALKLLSASYSQDPVFRERLFREAHTAGRLREAHVVPIHNCGEIDGQLFVDMRLIRGTDLQNALKQHGSLQPARAVAVVRQIAAALDAAHAEQIIHRDVKPANILLADDDFAYLVDFGLANAAADTRLTQAGATVGTFSYIAPERLNGDPIDHRADIYALACVLYECLTGAAPYAGRGQLALIAAHMSAPIPQPSRQSPDTPAAFDDVIARGMAKDPDGRYQSAGELAAAAQQVLPDQPADEPATGPIRTPLSRKPRRRRLVKLGALGTIAALVATVIAVVVLTHRTTGETRPSATSPTVLSFPNLTDPEGVAVDPAGNVYVIETLPDHESRVWKLRAGGTSAVELPVGRVLSEFIAADKESNLYVADGYSGGHVWVLALNAPGPVALPFGKLDIPVAVAVDDDGNIYAGTNNGQLRKLAPGSTNATQLMPTFLLQRPEGVAVGKDGAVYVADSASDSISYRVLKLAPGAAEPVTLPFPGLVRPRGVAVDDAGAVYVVESGWKRKRVLKLAPGASAPTALPFTGLTRPYGVAVDDDGNVYVTDCEMKSGTCVDGRVLVLGQRS